MKILKVSALVAILLLAVFALPLAWWASNAVPRLTVASPGKNSIFTTSIPLLANGVFEISLSLPGKSLKEVDMLMSKIEARVIPESRGSIVLERVDHDEENPDDLIPIPDGRHHFFRFRADGYGAGILQFTFQDRDLWPERMEIVISSLSL